MLMYINPEIMNKSERSSIKAHLFPIFILLVVSLAVSGQDIPKVSAPLPEPIKNIVSVSCMPCHSSTGGTMSKKKLNFDEWTSYPADKQEEQAEDIYKVVKKNEMPPKSAREKNPGIIPTREQLSIIKDWYKSF